MSIHHLRSVAAATWMMFSVAGAASALDLPARDGARPQTTNGVPHIQVDVTPSPEISDEMLRRVEAIPGVSIRPTVVSLPGALGFWIDENVELARADVIVGGREFAHLHPDGSLHASLSPELARRAIEAGWAVAHPWASRRAGWEGFVMIYTPLSQAELDVVVQLVVAGFDFVAKGETGVK